MSLGKLENNQTNLEWRNTINEAITTLEAVSGITYTLSAQNPDDGIGIFEYDVPAGYRALCTTSLNATEYS